MTEVETVDPEVARGRSRRGDGLSSAHVARSFYTTMNGGPKVHGHNPVTGTTRPEALTSGDRRRRGPRLARIIADDAGRPLTRSASKPSVARPCRGPDPGHRTAGGIEENSGAPHSDRVRAIVRMPWRNKGDGTPPACARVVAGRGRGLYRLRCCGGVGPVLTSRPSVTCSNAPRAGSAARTRRSVSTTSGTARVGIRTP